MDERAPDAQCRTRAHLDITSAEVPPDEITRRVGVEPDRSWAIGDELRKYRVATFHNWTLDSRADPDAALDDHIADLVRRAEPVAERIAAIDNVNIRLSICREYRGPGTRDTNLYLGEKTIEILGRLGASFDVDDYDYG